MRHDVEKWCFWDTPISFVFFGRSMATLAELCLANQIGMTFSKLAKDIKK